MQKLTYKGRCEGWCICFFVLYCIIFSEFHEGKKNMKLIIASNNAHKIKEIKAIVGDYFEEVLSQSEAGVDLEVEETGVTFAENAQLKAEAIMNLTGCAALADDSGLMVDALGGEPGVYSARYAGGHGDDHANNMKMMAKMEGVADNKRGAQFVSSIALARPGQELVITTGICRGVITYAPRGNGGFGYDPYFQPEGMTQTFAELGAEIKNAISHRAKALEALKNVLSEERK